MMRRTTLLAALAAISLLSASGTHAAGAPGADDAAVATATSELQEEYPLHAPGSASPNPGPGDEVRSSPAEQVRSPVAEQVGLPVAEQEGDGWPLTSSLAIALLLGLCLAALAARLAARQMARRVAAEVPPRPRHQVSALTIGLAWPAFRYCDHRDAFVLRLIGDGFGPVLVRDPVD